MNWLYRLVLTIYSIIVAFLSSIMIYGYFNEGIFAELLSSVSTYAKDPVYKYFYLTLMIILFLSAIMVISISINSVKMSRTRIRTNDIGSVDIGPDALESIALNSAKSAQVGIKNARVRVSRGKNDAIKIFLNAIMYSNVEIPSSMTKVQEKIKKDIERYTGLTIENVSVKVSKVEPVVAKVDK